MRNLNEYPITKEEVRAFFLDVSNSVDHHETGLVGDIRPSIIRQLLDSFDQVFYEIYDGRWPYEARDKNKI